MPKLSCFIYRWRKVLPKVWLHPRLGDAHSAARVHRGALPELQRCPGAGSQVLPRLRRHCCRTAAAFR